MMFQPGANLYTANTGTRPENIEVPHYDVRAPASTDIVGYPLGKWWVWPGNGIWELNNITSAGGTTSAVWIQTAGPNGAIVQILGTANQITATTTNNITTLSIPATFIAPGSIASTTTNNSGTSMTAGTFIASGTTITAGTSLTATLGNITATNGNLVLGTAGNKIVSTSVATTTAAGANSFGSVTLVGGTATVATTAVTANSLIPNWRQSVGASTALGELTIGTITPGVSFVINAATQGTPGTPLATDLSIVGWEIIN